MESSSYKLALKMYDDLAKSSHIHFGDESPYTAMAYDEKGRTQQYMKQFTQALSSIKKGMDIRTKLYAEDPRHPDIAQSHYTYSLYFYGNR
mmetsp:Transcript_35144/g.31638  ORF Transcript_35144/g.31638 Transcript_35144/m.31638 type:complete len:91 (-) Transcript_35144:282-554(-)